MWPSKFNSSDRYTAYLPQVAVYPTGHAHNLSRRNWRGDGGRGLRPGELAIRNGRERGCITPRVPRCLYFYCGECSVASSVVFRNYDTIPLHPLERCTAARQSLYILHYNRLTSLPAEYIIRLDAAEATAVNPLRFLVTVYLCENLCIWYRYCLFKVSTFRMLLLKCDIIEINNFSITVL